MRDEPQPKLTAPQIALLKAMQSGAAVRRWGSAGNMRPHYWSTSSSKVTSQAKALIAKGLATIDDRGRYDCRLTLTEAGRNWSDKDGT